MIASATICKSICSLPFGLPVVMAPLHIALLVLLQMPIMVQKQYKLAGPSILQDPLCPCWAPCPLTHLLLPGRLSFHR